VLGLGLKVVSISEAKGKKIIEAQKWKKPALPTGPGRAQRNGIAGLHFEREL
jgi:hypothetical protein